MSAFARQIELGVSDPKIIFEWRQLWSPTLHLPLTGRLNLRGWRVWRSSYAREA